MVDIRLDKAALLFYCWVFAGIASVWCYRVVVVVCPLREMVCKLKPGRVCSCVLEIDDNELLVFIGWLQERRLLVVRSYPQDVAVLGL